MRASLTFKSKQQAYCREYEVQRPAMAGSSGWAAVVAMANGRSKLIFLRATPPKAASGPPGARKMPRWTRSWIIPWIDGDVFGEERSRRHRQRLEINQNPRPIPRAFLLAGAHQQTSTVNQVAVFFLFKSVGRKLPRRLLNFQMRAAGAIRINSSEPLFEQPPINLLSEKRARMAHVGKPLHTFPDAL